MPMMTDLKHLLRKACNSLEFTFVALRVSDPYKRTDFTLVLNIRSFVFLDITLDFHTGLRIVKAVLAFPILSRKSSTSSSCRLSAFGVLIFIPFVFDLPIVRPAFAEIFASRVSLYCMPWWFFLWEQSDIVSNCMPYRVMFLCSPSVVRSMTSGNRKGDNWNNSGVLRWADS